MSDTPHAAGHAAGAGNGECKKFREMMASELATAWSRALLFALLFLISGAVWAGSTIVELQADKITSALSALDESIREIRAELKTLRERDAGLAEADVELRLQAQRNADAIETMRQDISRQRERERR
ncbi:MAG: hypothetical protein FJX59_17415 [Alphaproteobacteria bacterium]|nr:hypothetical protein [Alphaproteobacteria bacterium]